MVVSEACQREVQESKIATLTTKGTKEHEGILRRQLSVAAGVAFAGHERGWGNTSALAGLVSKSIEDAGHQAVGGDDSQGDNGDHSKGDDKGDNQPTQVRPAFPRAETAQLRRICADRISRSRSAFTLPALTLAVVSN